MSDKNYLKLLLGHIILGALLFLFPFLAKLYAVVIVIVGLYYIIKNKNKNNEVLLAAAYAVGSEVFLRATQGSLIYEYGKYSVILFVVLGFIYNGIPRKANPFWWYLLLLIPSIIVALGVLKLDVRTNILFNITGPICLGICALYTYQRKSSLNEMNTILLCLGLPIISFVTYIFLKSPLSDFEIGSTESNYLLSGGYAPNQVATILGLGMIVFAARFFLASTSRSMQLINLLLFVYLYYRTLLTFSRGGTFVAIAVIFLLLLILWVRNPKESVQKMKIGGFALLFPLLFGLTSLQTDGLLWHRYADQNPNGNQKREERFGRKQIALKEIDIFEKNPLLGVGVGEGKEIRKTDSGGHTIITHSEFTRLLAEHGFLGLASILILLLVPLFLFLKNNKNIYLICFFAYWILTINHSAMRVAASAFIYALMLLYLEKTKETNSV
ncbi:O-antigen ligase family protein [Flavobacterium sp. 25HG05S-40]|uniref:O-antigen ligase family protein n=1 Tax=Flavobacterium sp. 25HG05S-40 TaxID=3458682 RepID=UPI0040449ABE